MSEISDMKAKILAAEDTELQGLVDLNAGLGELATGLTAADGDLDRIEALVQSLKDNAGGATVQDLQDILDKLSPVSSTLATAAAGVTAAKTTVVSITGKEGSIS